MPETMISKRKNYSRVRNTGESKVTYNLKKKLTLPVVVKMAQLECKLLVLVRLQASIVKDDVVAHLKQKVTFSR